MAGRIEHFQVVQGETFGEGRRLVEMYDFPDLGQKIITLRQDIENLRRQIDASDPEAKQEKNPDATRCADTEKDVQNAKSQLEGKTKALGACSRAWTPTATRISPASSTSRRRRSPTSRPCGSIARSGRSSTTASRRN